MTSPDSCFDISDSSFGSAAMDGQQPRVDEDREHTLEQVPAFVSRGAPPVVASVVLSFLVRSMLGDPSSVSIVMNWHHIMHRDLHELSFYYFLLHLFIMNLVYIVPIFALDKLLIIIGFYSY